MIQQILSKFSNDIFIYFDILFILFNLHLDKFLQFLSVNLCYIHPAMDFTQIRGVISFDFKMNEIYYDVVIKKDNHDYHQTCKINSKEIDQNILYSDEFNEMLHEICIFKSHRQLEQYCVRDKSTDEKANDDPTTCYKMSLYIYLYIYIYIYIYCEFAIIHIILLYLHLTNNL